MKAKDNEKAFRFWIAGKFLLLCKMSIFLICIFCNLLFLRKCCIGLIITIVFIFNCKLVFLFYFQEWIGNWRYIHLNYRQQEFFLIRYLIAYERSLLLPEIRILHQVYLSGQYATRCCLNQSVTLVLISRIRWESEFGWLSCLVFSLPILNH